MNLGKVLEKTSIIVPQKIAESGEKPESLSPGQIEKVSLAAIRMAIGSIMPEAEAKHIGGQKFPDITVTLEGETDGVEIKSTRTVTNPWTVPGGSIREGNRVDGVNDVWLLFTKLADRVETRARPYADAVCDLAVTHSPRYILSMESESNKNLFARLGITYEQVRKSEQPFDFFREYLEQKASETGGKPWWFEKEPEGVVPPFIRFWEEIGKKTRRDGKGNDANKEKTDILAEAFALFAKDLFSSEKDKYKAIALHLLRKYSIISTCLRDKFTSGGQKVVVQEYGKSPRIFFEFAKLLPKIRNLVQTRAVEGLKSWEKWKEEILDSAEASGNKQLLTAIFRDYL